MDLCIYCAFPVRPRQEGLQCDGCSRWQHRTCHTGISQSQYRTAVKAEEPIDWSCDLCMNTTTTTTAPDFPPDVGNTTLEEESLDESGEPLFSDDASFGECFYNIIFWVFIFWRPLWSVIEETHGNMESITDYYHFVGHCGAFCGLKWVWVRPWHSYCCKNCFPGTKEDHRPSSKQAGH